MGRYSVIVGKRFHVEAVDVPDAEVLAKATDAAQHLEDGKVRRILALGIVSIISLALASAAIIGLLDGTYDEIGAVWDAAALPLGYVLATYFTKGGS